MPTSGRRVSFRSQTNPVSGQGELLGLMRTNGSEWAEQLPREGLRDDREPPSALPGLIKPGKRLPTE